MEQKGSVDLIGKRFGKLVVLQRVGTSKSGRSIWQSKCDCGNTIEVPISNLTSGNTRSCGCNKKVGVATHHKSDTDFYRVWQSMKTRCTNAKSNRYKYYGGKGIRYDLKWETFENFYNDMHGGYKKGLTLDRIDHNKGYTKENCRWVSYTKQNNNKADNIHLEYKGVVYTVNDAAKEFGLLTTTIYNRRRAGWSDSRILETKT